MSKITTEAGLLAIQAAEPLAARWFSLASYLLANGYTIGLYGPGGLDADAPGGYSVELHLDEDDGSCYWGYDWMSGDSLEHDENHCPTWHEAVIECGAVVGGLVPAQA